MRPAGELGWTAAWLSLACGGGFGKARGDSQALLWVLEVCLVCGGGLGSVGFFFLPLGG